MCGGSIGGVKTTVYMALRDEFDRANVKYADPAAPTTEIPNGDDEDYKNVVMSLPLLNGKKWRKFEFEKNIVTFTNTAQYDGTTSEYSYMENNLALGFRKMDAGKRLAINALLKSGVVVALEDANGTKYVMGLEEEVTNNSAEFTTGASRSDSNIINITLTDTTPLLPRQLTKAAWDEIAQNVEP